MSQQQPPFSPQDQQNRQPVKQGPSTGVVVAGSLLGLLGLVTVVLVALAAIGFMVLFWAVGTAVGWDNMWEFIRRMMEHPKGVM